MSVQRIPVKARGYQRSCVKALWSAYSNGAQRALFSLAVGLGKTYTAAFFVRRWLRRVGGRVLVLCHSRDVNQQSVGKFRDVLVGEIGVEFLQPERSQPDAKVLFASFQGLRNRLSQLRPDEYTLVIVDESHRGMAKTYRQVVEHFTPRLRLGMTGTVERMDGKDIRELFGPVLFRRTLAWGLAKGYLAEVDYHLVTDHTTDWETVSIAGIPRSELDSRLFVKRSDEEFIALLRQHMATVPSPKVLVFCSRRKECEDLAELLHRAESGLEVTALHSKMTRGEQDARLDRFRGVPTGTLFSVNKLQEGIDIPDVNIVVFRRATGSRVVIEQQLGRGLRPYEGKRKVRLVDLVGSWQRLRYLGSLSSAMLRRGGTPLVIHTQERPFSQILGALRTVLRRIDEGWTIEHIIRSLEPHRAALQGSLRREPYHVYQRTLPRGSLPPWRDIVAASPHLRVYRWCVERPRKLWTLERILEYLESTWRAPFDTCRDSPDIRRGGGEEPPEWAWSRHKSQLRTFGWQFKAWKGTDADVQMVIANEEPYLDFPLERSSYERLRKQRPYLPPWTRLQECRSTLLRWGLPISDKPKIWTVVTIDSALQRHQRLLPKPFTLITYERFISRFRLPSLPSIGALQQVAFQLWTRGWSIRPDEEPFGWTVSRIARFLTRHCAELPQPIGRETYEKHLQTIPWLKRPPEWKALLHGAACLRRWGITLRY